jgi:ABC-type sugar transport system permease subunit
MGFASTVAVVLFVLALALVAVEYAIADNWLGKLKGRAP